MKLIPLNTVKECKHKDAPKFSEVDDEDYDILMRYKWNAILGDSTFYASSGIRNPETGIRKMVQMHRLIMNQTNPKIFVDHKDHVGTNNQKENLRVCSRSENNRNCRSSIGSSSKYLGVYLKKYKKTLKKTGEVKVYYWWGAGLTHLSKRINLGIFKIEEDAARAYDKKAKELHGEFANLNFQE